MADQVSSSESHYELLALRDAVNTFGSVLAGLIEAQNTILAAMQAKLDGIDLDALTAEVALIRTVAVESHARSMELQEQASAYLVEQTRHAESYLDRTDAPPIPDTTPPPEAEPPIVTPGGAAFSPATLECREGGSCQL